MAKLGLYMEYLPFFPFASVTYVLIKVRGVRAASLNMLIRKFWAELRGKIGGTLLYALKLDTFSDDKLPFYILFLGSTTLMFMSWNTESSNQNININNQSNYKSVQWVEM
jgi:hypothetical protein